MIQAMVYTGMGLPPVVVGLAVYIFLSNQGVFGPARPDWFPRLFTISAMILAQVIIACPLIIGFTMSAVGEVSPELLLQVRSLGANRLQLFGVIIREARRGVVALIGGLGSIISGSRGGYAGGGHRRIDAGDDDCYYVGNTPG